RVSVATASTGRSARATPLPSDADRGRPVPRVADQRPDTDMADHVLRGPGRRRDPRCVQQEDGDHAQSGRPDVLTAAGIVPAGGLGEEVMKTAKRTRLERAGWRVGTAAQFLGLTPEEQQFVELKLALAGGVRQLRERRGLTQGDLAKRLGSSQSRIAKMEAAAASVSLDLLMRSLLSIGATTSDIAKLIKKAEAGRAA